jgi:membrane-associated PAP2 superfamily phosphatase
MQMISKTSSQFYLSHIAIPFGIFVLLLSIVEAANLDRRMASLFYDPALRIFPLRDSWLLQSVEHVAAKRAVILLGLSVFALWIAMHWSPAFSSLRRVVLFIFAGMFLSALSVATLRNASTPHCPYDLQQYGGTFSERVVADASGQLEMKPGKCWPSGHASAAFCLFSWYFAARALGRPRLAACLLGAIVAFGAILSMGRMAQGAHFLSHCIWTAIVCWFITVALYEGMLRRRPGAVPSPAHIPDSARQLIPHE